MEQQSKKIYNRALEIYKMEMNRAVLGATFNDLENLKKTQKQMEESLVLILQKELKSYSRLDELVEKLLVILRNIHSALLKLNIKLRKRIYKRNWKKMLSNYYMMNIGR